MQIANRLEEAVYSTLDDWFQKTIGYLSDLAFQLYGHI